MGLKEERQPRPGTRGEARQEISLSDSKTKVLCGPPALAVLGWILYPSSFLLRDPRLGFIPLWVTTFIFAALVFGLLVVVSSAWKWWKAPQGEKDAASATFWGWSLAWLFLFIGFQVVPWSGALP